MERCQWRSAVQRSLGGYERVMRRSPELSRTGLARAAEQSEVLAACLAMKPAPYLSEKRAAVFIWIGAAVFTLGAMIFGH